VVLSETARHEFEHSSASSAEVKKSVELYLSSAPAIRLHYVVRANLTVYFYNVVGKGDGWPLIQKVDAGLSLSPHVCL
jgi:hypothetical protein